MNEMFKKMTDIVVFACMCLCLLAWEASLKLVIFV